MSTVVHAYNATKHESTGYSPFYLMFGRHPRLPIDVAMGVEPSEGDAEGHDYTEKLRERLEFAYKLATDQSEKASGRHKTLYDRRVRGATVEIGDRVLVKNVGLRGKNKLANRWEDHVYTVLEKPNESIPVFVVKREDGRGGKRTLHRNLLLPVNFLPLSPKLQETAKTSRRELVPSIRDPVSQESGPLETDAYQFEDASESDSDSSSEGVPTTRYFMRSRLNPAAEEFRPARVDVPLPTPAPRHHAPSDVHHLADELMDQRAVVDPGDGEMDALEEGEILDEGDGDEVVQEDIPPDVDELPQDVIVEALPPAPQPHRTPPVPAVRRSTRERRQPVRFSPSDYGHSHQVSMELNNEMQTKAMIMDTLIALAAEFNAPR